MKKLIVVIMLAISTPAFAAGVLETNENGNVAIQGFSPDGRFNAVLTVVSSWIDMSKHAAYRIFCPADAKIRYAATASKTGITQSLLIGGQWNTIITNKATPFGNPSGCTNGYIERTTPSTN